VNDRGVFLFGANSMLGWSIFRAGVPDVTAFGNGSMRTLPPGLERGLHLDDRPAVHQLFEAARPRLIVHCAGVCDVEKCEDAPEFAFSVNVDGMQSLLDHAPADARIVYLSSDHVFSGDGGPYREDTPPDPLTIYGRTRVAAEHLLLTRPGSLVIRSGPWIGPSATGRNGHLDWLRYRHANGLPMTVVADEARSVVWAEDAARRVLELVHSGVTGIRHLTTTRVASRPELARYLVERFEIGARFEVESRRDRRAPHLGHVELATRYTDALAAPLPSVVS
jgi:dTDP-4-dehydrorhamnose reductase